MLIYSFNLSIFIVLSCIASWASAQDPSNGWMAYVVGAIPEGKERITRLEMAWTISVLLITHCTSGFKHAFTMSLYISSHGQSYGRPK